MYKSITKLATLLFLLSFWYSPIIAQNNAGCPNANLSMGNFNNWQGFTGTYANPAATPGIVAGRHTIMTGPGTDPFSCGGLPIVPPGSTTSARLGNSGTGAQGEQLRYSMTVTPQNALFIYKYACVLEDPGHPPNAQPVFQMRLLDQSGNQIGGNCGVYTVYAGQAGQNFQICGGVKWLPWTIVGVNLTAYTGQTVTVEFTTKDCDYSGHFGYAYVVAECMPLILDLDYCFGANVINISGPAGFQSYSWSSGQNTQSISVPAAQAQPNYTVTMQSFSNQGNCTVSLTAQAIPTTVSNNFTVTQACPWSPTQFTSTPTILPTTINGVTLANGGAASWFWNFGDGTTINGNIAGNGPGAHQHPSHTYANPGTYTVTHIVYTQAGCSDTISQTINVLPPPVINFSFNNACVFDTVNTTNQTQDPNLAQVTYEWLWGDGSANDNTINASHIYQQAGNYQIGLAATNIGGCVDTLYQTVIIHPLPIVFAGNDTTICPGFTVPLIASGASTYVWESGTANGSTYTPQSSEMLTVVGTDVNGCINSDSLYITLYPSAVVDAGPNISVCFGSSVTITGSGVQSYSWDNGLIDGQTFIPPVGVVTYTVTGTDTNGCIDLDSMLLTVWANPVVSAGNDQSICEADSTTVSGSGATSYVWNNGLTNNVYFTPLTNNTYTVIGTDNNGCVGTDSLYIFIEPAAYPSFNAPILAACTPFSFTLNNTSTGTPFTEAVWTFGNGATAVGAGPINYTYNSAGCYDIGLTLTTALGCEWDTMISDYLCSYVLPIADFEPSPMNITDLENTSTMINQSAGGSYYMWDFGDGSSSSEFEPLHAFPSTTTANYLITLVVFTENGCTDTTNRVVSLTETQLLYVPNTFTPDGNEYNQTWLPIITADFDPHEFSCFIYDRWGELIWENHNHLVGWDGRRMNGKPMQDDVYTWKIILKSPYRDERKAFLGHVTLLR